MATESTRPIGIYHEHPEWFLPLFDELDRRGLPYERIRAHDHAHDPSREEIPYALVFNRMSPSAHLRGHARAIFYTGHFLAHLERIGVRVVNGLDAWRTEVSKARQLGLFERLGIPYPKARVVDHPDRAVEAAEGLRFPVVVKPNVGGSGAGIRRFDDPAALERAAREGALDLGVDATALVQEFIPPRDGRIVRVEVMNDRVLYAIRVRTSGDDFNLCPADICADEPEGGGGAGEQQAGAAEPGKSGGADGDGGAELGSASCPADAGIDDRVEAWDPPAEIRRSARRIVAEGGMEIGGVEYLVDDRDGRTYFYDVNALSNFVADAPRIVGFDPFVSLVDWLEEEWIRAGAGTRPVAAGD